MVNIDDYCKDGKLKPTRIAYDIKSGKLKGDDLRKLLKENLVREKFIGKSYKAKIPQSEWTEDYLDRLANASVAEAFNEDYLFYLEEVAEYVAEQKRIRKKSNALLTVAGAIAVGVIACIIFVAKSCGK